MKRTKTITAVLAAAMTVLAIASTASAQIPDLRQMQSVLPLAEPSGITYSIDHDAVSTSANDYCITVNTDNVGITPYIIKTDENGNWQISADDGKTWSVIHVAYDTNITTEDNVIYTVTTDSCIETSIDE